MTSGPFRLVVLGPGHPFRGGIARTTTALAAELERRRHDILFLTPVRQYPRWLYPGRDDRDPAACPPLRCAEPLLDPLAPHRWRAVRRRVLDEKADAWIVPYWTWAWAGWWRFLLQAPGRPPAVAVVHNPADHDAGMLQRLAARLVLGRCEGLMTHGAALAERLRREHPRTPGASYLLPPVDVVEPPPRDEARRRLGLAGDGRLALFVGLIRPYKGVDLLLEAVAAAPGWRCVVAGEPWGNASRELTEQVTRLGIADRVGLRLGWVPEDELSWLLAAADLVVLPYRSGSQSAVAPMALAAGVPVLSTRVGGLAEAVLHGRDGLLVAPGSARELAVALRSLDDERLGRLRRGARERTRRPTWSGYAATLEGLLDEILS